MEVAKRTLWIHHFIASKFFNILHNFLAINEVG